MFKIVDVKDQARPLVVKVQDESELFQKEIHAMKSIYRRRNKLNCGLETSSKTPEIITSGTAIVLADNAKSSPSKKEKVTEA